MGEFGGVAHHWFDKVMILGGESDVGFGRGELIQPYRVIVAGKAAHRVGERSIPLQDIFAKACSVVLSKHLTGFDCRKHLVIEDRTVDYRGTSRSTSRYWRASWSSAGIARAQRGLELARHPLRRAHHSLAEPVQRTHPLTRTGRRTTQSLASRTTMMGICWPLRRRREPPPLRRALRAAVTQQAMDSRRLPLGRAARAPARELALSWSNRGSAREHAFGEDTRNAGAQYPARANEHPAPA
jgi:S-adenosylmethionine synthetase (AdoMet synthetase)